MKVLFIGDIVGAVGREIVREYIDQLKKDYEIDLVVANGENSAHGKGITRKIYKELIEMGVDVVTMGNHTYSKRKEILEFIDEAESLVVPANMEPNEYGQSTCVVNVKGKRVAITNLCGEVFMNNVIDSPFACMEDVLEEYDDIDIHLVDLHAEVTSEKIAFAYYFAGKIGAVVGTHTHVQTADERIVNGTAAISDLGMCGPYTSVIGADVDEIIKRFTTDEHTKYKIAEGPGILCGCVVTFDDLNNQAIAIERIQIRPKD
ncbi:MAG: TIGR00282 family metallophosphoesterase [Erysipelotrichaceae bacterium]